MSIKRLLLLFLFLLPTYFIYSLYSLDKHYFIYPLQYKNDIIIRSDTRGDGYFDSPRNGQRLHKGVDFFSEVGAPVLASRSGRVIEATKNNGMGLYVKVRHGKDMVTLYGHLSRIDVTAGEYVRQAEVIGAVGKTGNARYPGILPHLHFEIRKDGVHQDPLLYLE